MKDTLIKLIRSGFEKITDTRSSNISYDLKNQLSLAFAMFSLKDASLSLFRKRFSVRADNLKRVYGVEELPGDTALREGLDEVNPKELQALFKPQLDLLAEKGVLKESYVLEKYVAVPVDGTGHYCSGKKIAHSVWSNTIVMGR